MSVLADRRAAGERLAHALAGRAAEHPVVVGLPRGGVVVAAPVGPPGAIAHLRQVADDVVCLAEPLAFTAVGVWYDDFRPVGDDEVVALLAGG